MKLYGKYEFEVESGSSYFGVEDQGTYEFSFIRYDDCLGFEINQIIFSKFNIVSSGISTLHLNFNKKIYNTLHREIPTRNHEKPWKPFDPPLSFEHLVDFF